MNRIEVISRNTFINELPNNISLFGDNDALIIKIKGVIKDNVTLINDFYNKMVVVTDDDTQVNIFELKKDPSGCRTYQYVINNNCKVVINKFYYMNDYDESVKVDLDGLGANIIFNMGVMSRGNQKYNISINHNNKETVSKVYNYGVSFADASIDYIVNGKVKKGMINSILNQDNKIMTMNNGKGSIKPNLYIDENMVEAKHGASIGRFNEDEIFYLATRGINEEDGYKLLLKGFLLGHLIINDDIKQGLYKIIEEYGR